MSKMIEISCEIRAITPKAYLVYDGKVEERVPISMVDDYCKDGENDLTITSIFIPEWLAEEKGFI